MSIFSNKQFFPSLSPLHPISFSLEEICKKPEKNNVFVRCLSSLLHSWCRVARSLHWKRIRLCNRDNGICFLWPSPDSDQHSFRNANFWLAQETGALGAFGFRKCRPILTTVSVPCLDIHKAQVALIGVDNKSWLFMVEVHSKFCLCGQCGSEKRGQSFRRCQMALARHTVEVGGTYEGRRK